MNKQRQILVTVTYNDLGCIIDIKAEPYEEPNLQPTCNQLATDCISRQQAIDGKIIIQRTNGVEIYSDEAVPVGYLKNLPTVQPEPQEGHWIRRDCGLDVECKCSRCGYKDFVQPRDEYWFNRNFCPNCGAKMTTSTK